MQETWQGGRSQSKGLLLCNLEQNLKSFLLFQTPAKEKPIDCCKGNKKKKNDFLLFCS